LDFDTITARVPVYISYDDRYFQQSFQALPDKGYTAMFKNMLTHPNIEIRLNTQAKDLISIDHINKNIYFIDAVPTSQISGLINKYDIGLYILEASGFNELYALPNKFFEFIQARLCIAVSPNPEMASIVSKSKLGIVSKDHQPENMAKAIGDLSKDEIYSHKLNAHKNAWEYSAEKNLQLMQNITKLVIEKYNI
jgi:hypothetical protein